MPNDKALDALSSFLGDRFSTSKGVLEAHGQSETFVTAPPPDGVAFPETTEEVAEIVRICAEQVCPVIGWGAGTSLEGHALALRGGVTVDFSRMNKILAIDVEDMNAIVQPGVTREELNHELRTTGLFFPVDPGANATLGGMAATRASGTTAVRYGTMRDNVKALEVVLADGRVIHTGTKARKSSTGYDLTGLMVGSEGTLGLMTELTLRLQARPEATSAAVCAFETIDQAIETAMATIQMAIPVARMELLDAPGIAAVNAYSKTTLPEVPHLLVEFTGSETSVKDDAERFGEIAEDFGAQSFDWATKQEDRTRLWAARHNAYWALQAYKPETTGISTDICVPISKLGQAIADTNEALKEADFIASIIGHVGDGNYHVNMFVDVSDPRQKEQAKAQAEGMAERALQLGGTVSGEHGIGFGKLKFMRQEHGDAWDVMGQIKRALDPQNIMNPGKMVPGN